jgi:hypothetical protein
MDFRIKEVALKVDGTDIWYYPQKCIKNITFKGFWPFRRVVDVEEWQCFFEKDKKIKNVSDEQIRDMWVIESKNIVAFRDISEAEKWIQNYKEFVADEQKEFRDQRYRQLGAVTDQKKFHPIKTEK